jgi:hypothetical protein
VQQPKQRRPLQCAELIKNLRSAIPHWPAGKLVLQAQRLSELFLSCHSPASFRSSGSSVVMRYSVYESSPFGAVRVAGELDAASDREALKQARELLPEGPGELRQSGRVVCRFSRAGKFMLRS